MFSKLKNSISFRTRHQLRRARSWLTGLKGASFSRTESKYDRFLREVLSLIGPIAGREIIEIGTDSRATLLHKMAEMGAAKVAGINPVLVESSTAGRVRLIKGDAGNLPFEDASIDLILSISVLEHVAALGQVLGEAHRVLRPGACFYAEFGPIWSSAWGHHLWFYYGDGVVDWRTHALPSYGHLLMTESQMQDWCRTRFGDDALASRIVEFVYHSPDQNRLFFSDYQRIFAESGFEVLLFTGCPDIPEDPVSGAPPSAEALRKLRELFPDKTGFGYHVARVLLRKSSGSNAVHEPKT